MKLNKDDRREEMAAYGTMVILAVGLMLIIYSIFCNLLN
jgi:hypothetical protein